ncbi:AAA family ATPase [Pseudomonas kermanshahensis]|uniref:AAA family ATPase n=1 Tax=Pseudomonas kermanshahensis TaxID=2745482 RepID=UPI0023DC464E|nr:AAA family ATPase [Pseudomonas kermanshahensis]WEL53974.1 AAA family ATPase [Pseudomonas kermanshahensis]
MIKEFNFSNFGPLNQVGSNDLGSINLVIGSNSAGKTFLLKGLYAACRAQEETGRGNDPRDFAEVLSDKLYWTFQVDKLGDLVSKGAQGRLQVNLSQQDNGSLVFGMGPDTAKKIALLHNNLSGRVANSVFLPPKEVLSLSKVILKSALQDKAFGFDATYVDLVLALQAPIGRGRTRDAFKQSKNKLESMFQGRMEYDSLKDSWTYKKGNSKFSVNITAEGIKKISILDTLLSNRYISPDSIIFIDEPESALHPTAISQLMEIVEILAEQGVQFFMATHSYFVVKKLFNVALKGGLKIPVLMPDANGVWTQSDLKDGMPKNPIIEESVRLFDEELEISLS